MIKRHIFFGPVLATFGITAFASLAVAAYPPTQVALKPAIDLRQHPTGGKAPVDVSVGLYITTL